jgi:hypothetical protein
MERYGKQALRDAWLTLCEAEELAKVRWYPLGKGWIAVLPQWTSWLITEKAGVPADLIAAVAYVELRRVEKGLRSTKALRLWPPYATHIDKLMLEMPRFGAAVVPALKLVKGGRCAVPTA